MPPWRTVLWITSAQALLAALLAQTCVRSGPHLARVAPFDPGAVRRLLTDRPVLFANLGYLGHMWELYAMWAWVPIFLLASYESAGWSRTSGRLAGFAVIAIGAPACALAGALADRRGRTLVTSWSLLVSGTCAAVVGLFFDQPALATTVCLIWGFAVIADSAQFSTAVTELADPRYAGTALTLQTSLGFLLTVVSIWLIPPLLTVVGWRYVFGVLVIGPVFGVWSMLRLRSLPEAVRMASGRR